MPYAKRTHTFRAASGDSPAARARLGGVSLVDFHKYRLPTGRFVREHLAERGPTSIENGFRHPRLCQTSRVHVANDDQTVFVSQLCAGHVQEMLSPVLGLGMDSPDAFLVSGSLRPCEASLFPAIELGSVDLGAIAHDGEVFEAKINANFPVTAGQVVLNLADKRNVPAATGVLNKCASLKNAFDIAGLPEPELALEVDGSIAIDLDRSVDKRDPTQRALGSEAGTKARALLVHVAARCKLLADAHHGIGVQTEFGAVSRAELDHVERRRPLDLGAMHPGSLRVLLVRDQKIPDLIAGNSMLVEMLPDRGILYPKLECGVAHAGSGAGGSVFDQERVRCLYSLPHLAATQKETKP